MTEELGDYTMSGFGGFDATQPQGESWSPANGSSGIYQAGSNSTTAQMFFNELRFAAAKSIRTSTIILATFNAIAAFATALGILYNCYSSKKRNSRDFSFKRYGFSFVQTAEVFPLVLSLGITIQGIIFAVAQSTGLDNLLSRGCTLVSQFMLPGMFIVPYIQLVFGVEVALRGMRSKPFAPRGKWDVSICMAIIGGFLLANFLVADFIRTNDFCFASLFFFVRKYSVGIFAILAGITVVLIVCVAYIFLRLSRSTKVETTERVAASRMVYYLALAIISNSFMIPFFFFVSFINEDAGGSQALNLSMIASVVANVSGLMTGGLHLFLRSKTLSTIGPKDKIGEYERQKLKHQIRVRGPSDPDFRGHMMQPVSTPVLQRTESTTTLIEREKEEEAALESQSSTYGIASRPNPLRSNAVYPIAALPRSPSPAQMAAASSPNHSRKQSYSIFPSNSSIKSMTLLPATTYSPSAVKPTRDTLRPPPSVKTLISRHRRDSSMASSATVQIGLRLSSVDDMPPMNPKFNDSQTHLLDCPKEKAKLDSRPSPLAQAETASVSEDELIPDESPRRSPVKDARMKTLPPVPINGPAEEDDGFRLSPTVYSPRSPTKAKLPSPRGVGFGMPQRSNSAGPPRSPPPARRRANTETSVPPSDKADWI